jgi:hypothetical protein
MREQEHAHWGCAFFRHCCNEGLKLPTLNKCPECSEKYTEYRQDTANRRSVHERIRRVHPSDGRLLTVYFGAPSMFITLWFGFDYGTNPPLGTLII